MIGDEICHILPVWWSCDRPVSWSRPPLLTLSRHIHDAPRGLAGEGRGVRNNGPASATTIKGEAGRPSTGRESSTEAGPGTRGQQRLSCTRQWRGDRQPHRNTWQQFSTDKGNPCGVAEERGRAQRTIWHLWRTAARVARWPQQQQQQLSCFRQGTGEEEEAIAKACLSSLIRLALVVLGAQEAGIAPEPSRRRRGGSDVRSGHRHECGSLSNATCVPSGELRPERKDSGERLPGVSALRGAEAVHAGPLPARI